MVNTHASVYWQLCVCVCFHANYFWRAFTFTICKVVKNHHPPPKAYLGFFHTLSHDFVGGLEKFSRRNCTGVCVRASNCMKNTHTLTDLVRIHTSTSTAPVCFWSILRFLRSSRAVSVKEAAVLNCGREHEQRRVKRYHGTRSVASSISDAMKFVNFQLVIFVN